MRGREHLARLIHHPDRRTHKSVCAVIKYNRDQVIAVDSQYFHDWKIFFYGYYEPDILRVVAATIPPGATVFEVGANFGSHTISIAHRCGPKGHVVAFEPNQTALGKLRENVRLNRLTNIEVVEAAVSDTESIQQLYLSQTGKGTDLMNSSLLRAGLSEASTTVAVTTIDAARIRLGQKVDFIKIDVEGAEVKVLEGAQRTVRNDRPLIMLEYSVSNLLKDGRSWDNYLQFATVNNYRIFDVISCVEYHPDSASPPDDSDVLMIPCEAVEATVAKIRRSVK